MQLYKSHEYEGGNFNRKQGRGATPVGVSFVRVEAAEKVTRTRKEAEEKREREKFRESKSRFSRRGGV